MTRGRVASHYEPDAETVQRLFAWRNGCERRLTVRQIADQLGISPATLTRCIYRARAHDHPDAVRHPLADTYTVSTGLIHTISPQKRASRARRLAREQAAGHDRT